MLVTNSSLEQRLGSSKMDFKEVIYLGKYSMSIFVITNFYSQMGFYMESENFKCLFVCLFLPHPWHVEVPWARDLTQATAVTTLDP